MEEILRTLFFDNSTLPSNQLRHLHLTGHVHARWRICPWSTHLPDFDCENTSRLSGVWDFVANCSHTPWYFDQDFIWLRAGSQQPISKSADALPLNRHNRLLNLISNLFCDVLEILCVHFFWFECSSVPNIKASVSPCRGAVSYCISHASMSFSRLTLSDQGLLICSP